MVTDDTSACDKPVLYGPPSHHRWSTQEVVVDDDDDDCNNSAADVYHDLVKAGPSTPPKVPMLKMMVVDQRLVLKFNTKFCCG